MSRVLFVCVGNAGRSQMAEAFAREAGLDAASAGTVPSSRISSTATKAMAELGIDMAGQSPKVLDWNELESYDRTITMGCGVAETCPTLHTDEDWGLDDPAELAMEEVRLIRDDIKRRVENLAREMAAGADP